MKETVILYYTNFIYLSVYVNKNETVKKKNVIKKIFYSYDQSIDLPLIKLKNEIDQKKKE